MKILMTSGRKSFLWYSIVLRLKAGFHQRRSRNQKRRAYDLVKTAFRFQNVSDGVVSRVGRKWKRSDFSDSDSVALMTPLTTPIFDFH